MSEFYIFFDDGGVINDNSRRGELWKGLVADYFIPRFGGSTDEWADANTKALEYEISYYTNVMMQVEYIDFIEMREALDYKWIEIMFDHLSLDIPDNWQEVQRGAKQWIIPRAAAPYEGMVDVIRDLSRHNKLYTASNEEAYVLELYFKGLGISDCFERPYFGPDIINQIKNDRRYYDKIFEYLDINAEQAIIIEDNAKYVRAAMETGANVIQSCLDGNKIPITGFHIGHADELIKLIEILIQ